MKNTVSKDDLKHKNNHRAAAGCVLLALCVLFVGAVFGAAAQGDVLVSSDKSYTLGSGSLNEGVAYTMGFTANLTDGTTASTYDSENPGQWFALYNSKNDQSNTSGNYSIKDGVGEIIIDLGSVTENLKTFRVHLMTTAGSMFYQPESVTVSVCNTLDGDYTEVASRSDIASDGITDWFDFEAASTSGGRYVKFAFVFPHPDKNGIILLDELEVYTGTFSGGSESSEATSEETSEASSETTSAESLGEPVFEVALGNPGEWVAGEKFEVTASVNDIDVNGGIYIVSFVVQYDPAKIELLNDESDDGSLFVETNLPGDDWENLTHADRDNGLIEVEFSNPSGSDSAAVNDGDIALAFAFMPKNGLTGNVAVSVQSGSAVAGDVNFHRYSGSATSVSIPKGHIPSWIEVEHGNCGHSCVRHCYCSVCGKLLDTEVTPPTGEHTPGEWIITREAKYGVAGSREKRCTVCGKVLTTEAIPAVVYPKGDINGNGVIDAQDYAMAKRSVLGTFHLTEAQTARGDIDANGKVDAWDYAKIKRHFLGTYTIEN